MKLRTLLAATICLAATTSLVGCVNSYKTWRQRETTRLQADSQMVETALGPIEYRINGEGPAVVVAHGTPGGYDQGVAFGKLVNSKMSTFIAVSRPGYLQTPLASGKTPEEQADLYAALLDTLGIEKAAVIGMSGGGPSALQFALRHRGRCSKLVMISGVVQRYSEMELQEGWSPFKRWFRQVSTRIVLFDPFLYFLLPFAKLAPYAPSASVDLLRSVMLYQLRQPGYENDMEQFEALTRYPLEEITAPTFILHGTADDEVPYADGERLANTIPHAQFISVKNGSHQAFYTHSARIMPLLRTFLAKA